MPPRKKAALVIDLPADVSMDPVDDIYSNVRKCLEVKATMADVGRLYKLKDELLRLDWDSPSTLELKSLLLGCFESKIFYKSAPGLNFLALVFNLHPLLLPLINEILKRCVLSFPHQLVLSCGQVLFKAWQLSSGGMRLLLEQFITDWMRRALFTSTKTAERVRFLLSEFHGTRRTSEIDQLLSRYYGPILFRHTKVANWEVRFNAVALLCSAFPVMPPDRSAIEFEEKLTVQFRVLKEAMEDPNESVRKVAVVGTGRILRDFWEVLTIEQIAMVLDTLTEKCARDKKSVKTRAATINAFSLVMDNPLSHGVLGSEILPNYCKQLFNDESNLVRLAMAQFLQKISRSVRLADIVPQTNIFARLVAEHILSLHQDATSRQICEVLATIVAPSLFTSSVEDQAIKCERMAEMLPAGLLALTANLPSKLVPELDRVRLGVALMSKAAGKKTLPILLRASADLFRSAKWAGMQGTEDGLKDEESKKLCAFVYKHVVDREMSDIFSAELIDVLSTLDGTRLPMTFCRLEKMLANGAAVDLTRIASVWGMYGAASKWDSPMVESMLDIALRLDDVATLAKNAEQMAAFLHSVSAKFPNLGATDTLVRLSLASMLKLARHNPSSHLGALTGVIHRINVGLFNSLTNPAPAMKRAKTSKPSSPVQTSCGQMADFVHFYLSFLLATNLLCSVPLSACKFEELGKIYWQWAEPEHEQTWTNQCGLISQCIASQQSAALCLSLVESALGRVTDAYPSDSVLEKLAKETAKEFVFTNEFSTLLTKLSLNKGSARVLNCLRKTYN